MTNTLLVVDDSLIIRRMISDIAAEVGWTVLGEACNGQEAFDKYQELHPDMVTLDLVMPEYDGLHGLRAIIQADPRAKVLVVSALEQKSILKEAFHCGAADFLVKPIDKEMLINMLRHMVEKEHGNMN